MSIKSQVKKIAANQAEISKNMCIAFSQENEAYYSDLSAQDSYLDNQLLDLIGIDLANKIANAVESKMDQLGCSEDDFFSLVESEISAEGNGSASYAKCMECAGIDAALTNQVIDLMIA